LNSEDDVMDDKNNTGLLSIIMRAQDHQLCPECGGKMTETERTCENGTTFVWYRCSDKNCSGQWLQKVPRQQPVYSKFYFDTVYAH
jgi:predicted amidophosphoribosyltransferase